MHCGPSSWNEKIFYYPVTILCGTFLLSSTCPHPPSLASPLFFRFLNSILIRFNLRFNSGTLWSLLFFDHLLAFPSLIIVPSHFDLSSPGFHPLFILILPLFSPSFFDILRKKGAGQTEKRRGVGRKYGDSEKN